MAKQVFKPEKTLVRAVRILELLARSDQPMGVTEVATALRLGKSTVHRPLATLAKLGYVTKEAATGRYAATLRMWEVGSSVLSRLDLKRVAAEPMAFLSEATGETVHLSILDGDDAVHIDKIECQHPIRAYSRVGGRVPVHCIASGKAMLAFQPAALIKRATTNLKKATPDTIVDRAAIMGELAQIRRTGVSYSRGAWQSGVDGIAAPIRDANGDVVAGIGISGPDSRLRSRERARYSPLVIEAAARVSRALGFIPASIRNSGPETRRGNFTVPKRAAGSLVSDGASHYR